MLELAVDWTENGQVSMLELAVDWTENGQVSMLELAVDFELFSGLNIPLV
ncbi:hypothetical protein DIPPA_16429 [Diplonema papillatum]|nr:hypothetical protein DIPPA_16429 [Diplonema papillatum]